MSRRSCSQGRRVNISAADLALGSSPAADQLSEHRIVEQRGT